MPIAFGGKKKDGEADLSGFNWQKVMDYFDYELASMMGRTKDIKAAQNAAKDAYGHMFIHYAVYEVWH
jgi:hypothetical protein